MSYDDFDTVAYVTPRCRHCGKTGTVDVSLYSVKRWKRGTLAQDAFPHLGDGAREQLISGTHPECWTELFGEES